MYFPKTGSRPNHEKVGDSGRKQETTNPISTNVGSTLLDQPISAEADVPSIHQDPQLSKAALLTRFSSFRQQFHHSPSPPFRQTVRVIVHDVQGEVLDGSRTGGDGGVPTEQEASDPATGLRPPLVSPDHYH